MSELVGGDSPEDRSLFAKFSDFCSHHWWSYYGGILSLLIVANLMPFSWLSFGLTFLLLLGWFSAHDKSIREHGGQLCLKCLQRVPDDPQSTITRYRRDLRLFHWEIANRKHSLISLVYRLFFMFGLSYAVSFTFGNNSIINSILHPVAIFAPLMFAARIMHIHQWLRPWCPQCRGWEDGGVHENVPTPDPTGAKTA